MARKAKLPEIKNFHINISYAYKNNVMIQTFDFVVDNKKVLRYAYDKRYNLKKRIDEVIRKESNSLKDAKFINRIDTDTGITIYYEIVGGEMDHRNVIKNVSFYLPPNAGCQYCKNYEKHDDASYCSEKKKFIRPVKSCKIFQSLEEIIT